MEMNRKDPCVNVYFDVLKRLSPSIPNPAPSKNSYGMGMCQMFPMSVERKFEIECDPLTSQRKTRTELIRSRTHHLAIVVNGTRWPVTHVTEKHWSGFAVFFFLK